MEAVETKTIFTVTKLTRNIRAILEQNFGALWVEGEISNFTKHQSGHMYFSIKDEASVLPCVLFRSSGAKLKFEMKSGMHVLCFGRISVYDKRGQYQLYVERVEPKGAGALQMALEQLKEKLRKEGLFDDLRKKPIPYLPRRVGVITSPTGAAIRDILNVTKRRFANIEILLNPVRVQGEMAKHEIVEAIAEFNKMKGLDVIILARGGGSLEDLWAFNEEIVARAIYESKIPIISAVGHEVDWTISDFVGDFRAPTPSAAAGLVIPKKEDIVSIVKNLSGRLKLALLSKLKFLSERLRAIEQSHVFKEPLKLLSQREQEIDEIKEILLAKAKLAIKFRQEGLNTLMGRLGALSPLGILNRGYSIVTDKKSGKIIKDANVLKKDSILRTRLMKGEVVSRVLEIVTS